MLRRLGGKRALLLVVALVIGSCAPGPTVTPAPAPTSATSATPAATRLPVSSPAPASPTTPAATVTPGSTRPIVQDEASQKAWREDLHTLVDQLRQNHPNPFNETPVADFQTQVDKLDQEIPYLTRDQVILGLIRLAAMIDGHTHIQITQPALGYHVYPLHLYFFSDGLYVIDARQPHGVRRRADRRQPKLL